MTTARYFNGLNTAYKPSAGTKAEGPSMSQIYAEAPPSPEICRHFGMFDYTDYSGYPIIVDGEGREGGTTTRKGKPRFPETLFQMLQNEAENDREDIGKKEICLILPKQEMQIFSRPSILYHHSSFLFLVLISLFPVPRQVVYCPQER